MSTSVSPKLEEAWDQASRFPVKVFKGHTNETRLVASLKDGQRVVSGSNDGTIRIWDVEDVGKHETMTHGLWVRSISISSNEKRLVSGGNGATTMWDIETRAVVWKIDDANASLVAISPDGRLVAATSSRRTGEPGSEIVFLDAESGKHIRWLIHDDDLEESCLGFSPNGTRLAVGSLDGTVRLFDVVTGEMVLPFVAHEGGLVNALLFTHDGQQIITASDDRSIRVWDGATGQEVGEPMRGHTSYILEISLSPDGRRLASAAADRTVRVWDLNTRRQIGEPLQAQHKSLFLVSVAWSSGDGAYVVAGDHKGNVHLWTVPPLEDTDHVAAPVLDTSGPPRASTSRLRSNSVSSSILNLPAGSPPTPPQSRQLTTGPGEDDNWEYSTNDSFDSVLDLPADGNHRAQKRKRRRRRVAPITSTSSPPISVVPTNSQALSAIINPPHRSPLDQTPNPPVQTTPDAHPVTDSPSLRVGALSRLWRKRRSPSRWTRRKTRKNHAKLHEGQPVQSSPAPNASANDIETQPQPTRATLPHHEVAGTPPKSRLMSRLLARPKRHAKKTTPAPENIEMDPRPNPRHRARNSSPHTRPRRQHQSEVVNVAAGRLDQRLAASSNKWTDKIDWLDYICFCMCCPWNKTVSESDSERRRGSGAGVGAGTVGSSGSSSSSSSGNFDPNNIY